MSASSLDQDPGLAERVEYLAVEQFIAKRPVEAFAVAIPSRAPRRDVERLNAVLGEPLNSGPLSDLICVGGLRVTNSSARVVSTSSLLSLRVTGSARHSLLALSMIDMIRYLRPSCVRPSTKS